MLLLLSLSPPPLLLLISAAATCNKPFEPNPAAEACFKDKEACWQRDAKGLLTGPEKQALGMLQYPPKIDRWGRQAFDYADDVSRVNRCLTHESQPAFAKGSTCCSMTSLHVQHLCAQQSATVLNTMLRMACCASCRTSMMTTMTRIIPSHN
jgi:hypothetical protein